MIPQLYLTYGTTTLDFQADGYEVVGGFYPETADEGMESISDQFNVVIRGSSGADVHSKITAIRLAFEHAKRHKDDAQAAWFYYEVDNTGDAWMSKLLNGSVIYDSKLESTWRHNQVVATIIVEHKPYWDAKDEIQVPLSNGNGTNDLNGLTVYNHDDAGVGPAHDNWVEIAAADVEGDLPGPTRLEMINSYATDALYILWIGQNWTDPANFSHILEGESSLTGTETDEASCSNAHYMLKALASGAEADMYMWLLSDSLLDACQGQYYKIIARFHLQTPYTVKFRLRLKYGSTLIWQSGQVTVDTSRNLQIRDLFTLRLPPWLLGQTNLGWLNMILAGQQSTGAPIDVKLDFLQLTPLDGWRQLECVGYGAVQNERIVDDGVNGSCYTDNGAGDNKSGRLIGYGNPIELYPGKKQRLYFLMHSDNSYNAEIARTISVKLFYHPRRRTL